MFPFLILGGNIPTANCVGAKKSSCDPIGAMASLPEGFTQGNFSLRIQTPIFPSEFYLLFILLRLPLNVVLMG